MKAYSKKFFELQTRDKAGYSLKEVLEGALSRARKKRNNKEKIAQLEEELKIPQLPLLCEKVFSTYLKLDSERNYTGMGEMLPLSAKDILPWMTLYGENLTKRELRQIQEIDNIRLKIHAESRKNTDK